MAGVVPDSGNGGMKTSTGRRGRRAWGGLNWMQGLNQITISPYVNCVHRYRSSRSGCLLRFGQDSIRANMDEQRKFAILFAATILSARRIQESMTSNKPDMAKQFSYGQKTRRAHCLTHEPHFKRRFLINLARSTLCLGQSARILRCM
jgi:hypothetical protein